jgi:ArsR family transcriptional regulator
MDHLVKAIRAIAEPTRMRILVLLHQGELTVSELTQILGQSQPRVSRHVGLLVDAGLVERLPEGTWMFSRLVTEGALAELALKAVETVPEADPVINRDRERLELVKSGRADAAAQYFRESAPDWDKIRSLHLSESDVEQALLAAIGPGPFARALDIGTGSGRILEILSARIGKGIGIDLSHEMLNLARTKLRDISNCAVQQADLFSIPLAAASQDLVTIHQVLHYLVEPQAALAESARVLKPGGMLALVDFAPHQCEFLRERHAHRRLGFTDQEMEGLLTDAGLFVQKRKTLHPDQAKDDQPSLTVKIWIAERRSP